jgi:hypothetical protein
MSATVISAISSTLLVLGATAALPRAVAALIRACIPVATAISELRGAVTAATVRQDRSAQSSRKHDAS